MRRGSLIALLCLLAVPVFAQPPTPPITTAQAEATRPGVPPANVPPSETLSWGLALSVVANGLMRKAKDSKAPWLAWIKPGAGNINLIIAAVLAGLTSLGIHTEFDKAAGTFLISGLSASSLLHFGGDWLKQYALQQFSYQAMKSPY